MDIRIKTDGSPISEATQAYLDERFAHIEKLLGTDAELARCEVEIGRDAGRPRHGANIWFAEITLIIPGREDVRATNHSESVNGAIDDVRDEITRQIKGDKKAHTAIDRKAGREAKRKMHEE